MPLIRYGIPRYGNKIHIIGGNYDYAGELMEVSLCGYVARSKGFRCWRQLRDIDLHPLHQIGICQHCLDSYQKRLDEDLKAP